jgi:hypothetical protein
MKRALLCWLVICAIAIAVGLSSFWLPAPLPADAVTDNFAANRAIETVEAIAQAPHPAGSEENRRVREYLLGQMRELGLNPRTVEGKLVGTPLVDLYGVLPGAQSSNAVILLVAHYDSVYTGPGASDDGAGVATILETIRALKTTSAISNTIGVLLTDGEERGLLGAKVFTRNESNLVLNVQLVINLEARGNHGPVGMFQTGPGNNRLIQFFSGICPMPVAMSFSADVARYMPNDTDFTVFRKAGKRGYNFAYIGGFQYYHSPHDTPENLNLRTLQHYGDCVFRLTQYFARADADTMGSLTDVGDATYFPVCRGVLVHYPAALAKVLAILTALLFIGVAVRKISRFTMRFGQVAASLGVTILAMVLTAAIGLGGVVALVKIFKARHYGPFIVGISGENGFVVGFLVLAGAITIGLRSALLRRANFAEQLAGAIALWVLLTLVLLPKFPGAAYLFMWPSFFGTVALLISRVSSDNRSKNILITILTAAPAPLIWAPTLVLLHEAITIGLTPFSLAVTAMTLALAPLRFEDVKPRRT